MNHEQASQLEAAIQQEIPGLGTRIMPSSSEEGMFEIWIWNIDGGRHLVTLRRPFDWREFKALVELLAQKFGEGTGIPVKWWQIA